MKRFVFVVVGIAALLTTPVLTRHDAVAAKPPVKYVDMKDSSGANPFAFVPKTITIKVGTKVEWRNKSSQPHTVTATNKAFDSGTKKYINPKKTWYFVFKKAGTYSYYCILHPYMKGKIIVKK